MFTLGWKQNSIRPGNQVQVYSQGLKMGKALGLEALRLGGGEVRLHIIVSL